MIRSPCELLWQHGRNALLAGGWGNAVAPPGRCAGRGHEPREGLPIGVVFDPIRVRLVEIGEAVKDVSSELLGQQPLISWRQVAAMRDQLAHRYFDTSHAIATQTVGSDLAEFGSKTG